jgi:hypothetical protein
MRVGEAIPAQAIESFESLEDAPQKAVCQFHHLPAQLLP